MKTSKFLQFYDKSGNLVTLNEKPYSPSSPPPYPVTSVAGKTGAVTLAKSDVGLGNVDNVKQYSASNKPTWNDVTGKPTSFTPAAHNHDSVYAKLNHSHSQYASTSHSHSISVSNRSGSNGDWAKEYRNGVYIGAFGTNNLIICSGYTPASGSGDEDYNPPYFYDDITVRVIIDRDGNPCLEVK